MIEETPETAVRATAGGHPLRNQTHIP
jgi:hypothetical protein